MRNVLRLRGSALVRAGVFGTMLAFAVGGSAQEKHGKTPEVQGAAKEGLPPKGEGGKALPADPPEPVFGWAQGWQGMRISAALQMIAVPNPISVLGVRLAAASDRETGPLLSPDWDLTLEEPLPLSAKLLDQLVDDTPVPKKFNVPLNEIPPADLAYYRVVCQALIYSRLVPEELFEKAGEKNRYVTFDHLFSQPKLYRGQVVPVIGRMIRLRRWAAPRLAQEYGVAFTYEAWVVGPTPRRSPYCIVFTELPEGLREEETMDRPIRFYGYFIKKFRYTAEKEVRRTSLVIGKTVILEKAPPPAPPTTPYTHGILIATLGGLLGIAVLIIAMAVWFRRGDRAIHSKLDTWREQALQLGDDDAGPPPEQSIQPGPGSGPDGPGNGT